MNDLVDLHIHSNCSDGLNTPSELVKIACESGLTAIALTDHDSTDGIDEAVRSAAKCRLIVIPAVELSVSYKEYHDVHLLGYWIDHKDPAFLEKLKLFRDRRETRGIRIIERINQKLAEEKKTLVAQDKVLSMAGGALGRPHIARELMELGHAETMQDAFTRYLLPCNVPKEYFNFYDALSEIKRIGGVAVLAHPQSITRNRSELATIISEMAGHGLDGIEAYNTMGIDDDPQFLKKLAASLGLITTGGSDFHGGEEGLCMGRGRGNLYLTADILSGLEKCRSVPK